MRYDIVLVGGDRGGRSTLVALIGVKGQVPGLSEPQSPSVNLYSSPGERDFNQPELGSHNPVWH
jgi:hypothetical protein